MKQGSNEITRRQAIWLAGGVLVWVSCGGRGLDLGFSKNDSYDDVLDKIHTTDPELDGGATNHAPMAIEALLAMDMAERVVPFMKDYDEQMRLMERAAPLSDSDRESALGDFAQRAGWIAAYEEELIDGDPAAIIARDWATLAPAMMTATFHGLLRVGHGVRAFEAQDTVSRRRELAHALGYWSAAHETLPVTPGAETQTGFDVVQAFEALPIVPRKEQQSKGLIKDRLAPALDNPDLISLIERVDFDALDLDVALTELCAAAARAFVDDGGESISLLHAITGPSSLRLMWHWLDDAGKRLGLGYAFQVAAVVISAQAAGPIPSSVEGSSWSSAEVLERSAKGGAHAIKLGEAAVRENEIDPRPEFLRAAQLWAD